MDKIDHRKQDDGKVDYSLVEKRENLQDEKTLQYKLEMYQRIIREWSGTLSLYEFAVVMQLVDRTVGWGETRVTVSTGSIMHGGGVYSGLGIKRTKLFEVLASLEEKKIIRRSVTKGGAARISINVGWTPAMLNIPKRLQNKTENEGENDQNTPSVSRTTPSATRTTPSATRTLYTSNLSTGNLSTSIVAASGDYDDHSGKLKNPDVPEKLKKSAKNIVSEKVEEAKAKSTSALTAKVNRNRGRSDVSAGMESAWRMAMEETFPSVTVVPWSFRHKKNAKDKAKAWTFNSVVTFDDLLDWSVRHWTRIIAKNFQWMKKPVAPVAPDIGFFIRFCDQFGESYASGDLEEFRSRKERTELEQLMARGQSHEEALNTIAKGQAVAALRDEMKAREARSQRRLREAKMLERQAVEIAKNTHVSPRRPQRPKPTIVVRDGVKFDEASFPLLPKENPFK